MLCARLILDLSVFREDQINSSSSLHLHSVIECKKDQQEKVRKNFRIYLAFVSSLGIYVIVNMMVISNGYIVIEEN